MTKNAQRAKLRARLLEAMTLKDIDRAGWVRVGVRRPESVAAHSWGVAWLVLVLCPPAIAREQALAMAVVHDLAEVRTGDLTPDHGLGARAKDKAEGEALAEVVAGLERGEQILALWREYADAQTPEARFVKACDKLDMALMASRYADAQGIDTAELVTSALTRLDDETLRRLADPGGR